jgi:hypothetical protein
MNFVANLYHNSKCHNLYKINFLVVFNDKVDRIKQNSFPVVGEVSMDIFIELVSHSRIMKSYMTTYFLKLKLQF